MGNADLRDLAVIEQVSFDEVAGVVAVDAHNWLYRYLTTTVRFTASDAYTTEAGEEVANLIGIVQGLPKFFEHDLTPVFVFDGGVTELKADEVAERRERREAAERRKAEAEDAAEIARLDAQTQRLTETIQRTSRELLERLDVPVVEAPAEGEAQCAYMNRIGDADYSGTEDYDALLFGGPFTLRQLTSSGDPELMDLQATLDRHGVTREQLIDAAMLCGTDFNEGIDGIGPATAIDRIKRHGDIFGVLDAEGESMPNADRVRQLFRDPPTTDEYTIREEIRPDVAAARQYVRDWRIPDEEVARGFERLETAVTQTGLDEWT